MAHQGYRPLSGGNDAPPLPGLLPGRLRPSTRTVDVTLAIGLALLMALVAGLGPRSGAVGVGGGSLATVGALTLAWRRRYPLGVLGVAATTTVAEAGIGAIADSGIALVIATYTVASRRPRPLAVGAAIGALAATIVARMLSGGGFSVDVALPAVLGLGGACVLGLYTGTRRAYVAHLGDRAERLERERDLLAGQAVAEERARIARELHDVVAHHVSLLVVQAGALRQTVAEEDRAAPMLDSMATTGRQALGEMRRMLGLLGRDGEAAVHEPQPGIGDLPALIARARAAGVPVSFEQSGAVPPLSPGIDLAVYRIAQEALTNAIRHAPGSAVAVTVRFGSESLELEVVDAGGRAVTTADVGGHGLVGMRERVALYGGELTAGPTSSGGFGVYASLPIGGDPA